MAKEIINNLKSHVEKYDEELASFGQDIASMDTDIGFYMLHVEKSLDTIATFKNDKTTLFVAQIRALNNILVSKAKASQGAVKQLREIINTFLEFLEQVLNDKTLFADFKTHVIIPLIEWGLRYNDIYVDSARKIIAFIAFEHFFTVVKTISDISDLSYPSPEEVNGIFAKVFSINVIQLLLRNSNTTSDKIVKGITEKCIDPTELDLVAKDILLLDKSQFKLVLKNVSIILDAFTDYDEFYSAAKNLITSINRFIDGTITQDAFTYILKSSIPNAVSILGTMYDKPDDFYNIVTKINRVFHKTASTTLLKYIVQVVSKISHPHFKNILELLFNSSLNPETDSLGSDEKQASYTDTQINKMDAPTKVEEKNLISNAFLKMKSTKRRPKIDAEKDDDFQIKKKFTSIAYTLFILMFLYFWWQEYTREIDDTTEVSTVNTVVYRILLNTVIYSALLYVIIIALLWLNTIVSQRKQATFNPFYIYTALYFITYMALTALICSFVTHVYTTYLVDKTRVDTDPQYKYVVIQVAMFANMIMFLTIFHLIKPDVE